MPDQTRPPQVRVEAGLREVWELLHTGRVLDTLDDDTIRSLFAAAVKTHFLAKESGRCESPFPVSGDTRSVTATEAAVAASAAIEALGIELFELAMWQTSASRHGSGSSWRGRA